VLVIIHLIAVDAGRAAAATADIRPVTVHQLRAREAVGAEEVDAITDEQLIAHLPYGEVGAGVIVSNVCAADAFILAMRPECRRGGIVMGADTTHHWPRCGIMTAHRGHRERGRT